MILLSLAYFFLLALPNATGAKTPEMLSVFEVDEYAQYSHALQLLNPADTLKGSLRNFLVYDHYFYGYPFYFFSGLSLIPVKWIAGIDWRSQTQVIVLVLRQLVNVLPNILSVWLLTYSATRFRPAWKSMLLFTLLLFSPGLLGNSLWWHPDAVGLMFVSLAFFLLRLDRLRFGIFYSLCAAAVGVAFGVKYMGAFFFLLIPAYLLIGLHLKKITWGKMALHAAVFVGIMLVTVVASNPLLLLQERSAIIENQVLQFSQTSQGILMGKQPFLQNGRLPQWFTANYGMAPFLLLLAGGLAAGIARKESRIQSILLAAWVVPYSLVILNASSQRQHYWLPILLPLMAVILPLFPDRPSLKAAWPKKAWLGLLSVLVAAQLLLFVVTDVKIIINATQREQTSPSLQFTETVRSQWIATNTEATRLIIYRDWRIYYPADENAEVFIDWELANNEMIETRQPDYLLLEKANVITYGAEDYLESAPDAERLEPMHRFYRDALLDQIDGYSLVYQDSFGMVFKQD